VTEATPSDRGRCDVDRTGLGAVDTVKESIVVIRDTVRERDRICGSCMLLFIFVCLVCMVCLVCLVCVCCVCILGGGDGEYVYMCRRCR